MNNTPDQPFNSLVSATRQDGRPRSIPFRTLAIALVAATVPAQLSWGQNDDAQDPYARILVENGIGTDAKGVLRFLGDLQPNEENRRRATELINQLGDEEFSVRETAASALRKRLPTLRLVAGKALERAARSRDLEVQARARRLLAAARGPEVAFLLRAVLKRAARLKPPETVAAVIPLLPSCEKPYVLEAAEEALRAAARPDDAARLQSALRQTNVTVRVAAIGALGRILGAEGVEQMQSLLSDREERVQLAAGRALANRGDRSCLEPLARLLNSDDLRVRVGSVRVLRALSSKQFGFVPFEKSGVRRKAAEAWTAWIREEGPKAKLAFPLKERAPEIGRLLICVYGENKIIELDLSGKQTFEAADLKTPWGCQGLPNGHRLVASYSGLSIVEYDSTGKEVWKTEGLPGGPMSVQRLENGHTLVACSTSNKIVAVDHDGEIAWELTVAGQPCDAKQLENGNFLVTLQGKNKVVEITREGEEIWTLEFSSMPRTAQRLPNGNTLVSITGAGKVVEYSRSKKEVWSKDGFSSPFDAWRLPSGNTLVSDTSGVTEVDPSGEVVWKKALSGASRIHRY